MEAVGIALYDLKFTNTSHCQPYLHPLRRYRKRQSRPHLHYRIFRALAYNAMIGVVAVYAENLDTTQTPQR